MSEGVSKNAILFDNLLNRLLKDESTGQYSLPGVITDDERLALVSAFNKIKESELPEGAAGVLRDHTAVAENSRSEASESAIPDRCDEEPASLVDFENTESVRPSEQIVSAEGIEALLNTSTLNPTSFLPDIYLGLDFGTAYSKACMIKVENEAEVILDLPLGIYAGEDALEMPVHSSLFIDPDGRLYFGPIAVEKSLETRRAGVRVSRIDSIKSFLIEEKRVTIDDSPLQKAYNPTSTEVSKAMLLTFYLGYLLYLVREAAQDKHSIDISQIKQRISLPCYSPSHRSKVINEISKLFTLGEVLSQSFRDEWENGFRIEDVKYLYDWMRQNIKKNSPYIERFLEEPLAVAGSRISLNGSSRGNVCMVVDVGAGTTDFTMFEIYADAKSGHTSAKEVKGSEYGVPIAGDRLDKILLAFILRDAGIARGSENYPEVLVSLRLDIRDYKERLFLENQLTYSLPGGATGSVVLSDFLADNGVREFTKELREAFIKVLSSIHQSWVKTKIRQKNAQSKLAVILSGGGADLPMVKGLAKGSVDVNGYTVDLFLSPTVPNWIEDEYKGEIIDLYPQMAVSLGSAKSFVIEKTGVQDEFL